MMHEEKQFLAWGAVGVVVVVVLLVVLVGPQRCSRKLDSWSADAYGANWLVVLHAQDGSVIKHWVLVGKSIGSEDNSDGIYFTNEDGNVVHLSGHYIYIQTEDDPDELAREYLRGRRVRGASE